MNHRTLVLVAVLTFLSVPAPAVKPAFPTPAPNATARELEAQAKDLDKQAKAFQDRGLHGAADQFHREAHHRRVRAWGMSPDSPEPKPRYRGPERAVDPEPRRRPSAATREIDIPHTFSEQVVPPPGAPDEPAIPITQ